MSRCRKCSVEILDATESCPLCHSVLEQNEEMENMYPNARQATKKMVFFIRIYMFCAIIAEFGLIIFDLSRNAEIKWSVVIGLLLLYIYTIFRYAVIGKTGYRSKIIVLTLVTVLIAIAADFATGYHGWAVDFVLSIGIILVDIVIFILMMYNHRNWQSYIMWQILMILCSIIPTTLYIVGIERYAHLAFAPLFLSSFLFLGTLIIGGPRARTELQRRFHI